MTVHASRLPRDVGTILRVVVVPFILGIAVFPLAYAAGDMGSGFLGGRLDYFVTVWLVGSSVAGFVASAVAGRDHGWLGYVSAAAGVAAGVLWFAVQRTDGGNLVLGTIQWSFLFWVPLGLGYAAQRVVRTWVAPR